MTDTTTRELILQDLRSAAPFAAHATTPPRDLSAAYQLQDAVAEQLVTDPSFGPVAGWKIAVNSAALLARFGMSEPVSGRIFEGQRHDVPAELTASDYRQFAIEPEIAAIIGTTLALQDAPRDADTVKRAIARFVPAMELLDMRDADMPNMHLPDAVAQNISNVGAVIGGPGVAPDQLDLAGLRMTLSLDGEIQHDATGAAPQHPVEAVTWLVNHLSQRGLTLAAGQVVLCGTHSPIWYHNGTGQIEVQMSGLGGVKATLT
ncbi:2-keto-4-pentenoate hydratase [Pseudooceanicola sp.]|uniref:2-keto-4-pentenoate hydratase n=1 Tax=Pseudooceanicola sp. TaxID=1914328 RepID=UPI00351749DB